MEPFAHVVSFSNQHQFSTRDVHQDQYHVVLLLMQAPDISRIMSENCFVIITPAVIKTALAFTQCDFSCVLTLFLITLYKIPVTPQQKLCGVCRVCSPCVPDYIQMKFL